MLVQQQEISRQVRAQGSSTPRQSFHPTTHDHTTHPPTFRRENALGSLAPSNERWSAGNHLFYSASHARLTHPHSLRLMHALGSTSSTNVFGLANNCFCTDVMVPSRRLRQQDGSPNESDCQTSNVIEAMTNQKNGLLKEHILRRVQTTSIVTTRPFNLNRGPDYPTCLRIGTVPRLRKVQHSRLGVTRGPNYPLPTETEMVSASRKTHITAQTSLSRGPDHPTFTRIEAVSISEKAQIRRSVHPFSTGKSPQQFRRS